MSPTDHRRPGISRQRTRSSRLEWMTTRSRSLLLPSIRTRDHSSRCQGASQSRQEDLEIANLSGMKAFDPFWPCQIVMHHTRYAACTVSSTSWDAKHVKPLRRGAGDTMHLMQTSMICYLHVCSDRMLALQQSSTGVRHAGRKGMGPDLPMTWPAMPLSSTKLVQLCPQNPAGQPPGHQAA